ncbi:MAG: [protein-PII] uridylyltransferase [Gammaproteobacteria bacterium]|nr:[protein-PII] uridylyltransferase [Gammaproteobacteria bacterium]
MTKPDITALLPALPVDISSIKAYKNALLQSRDWMVEAFEAETSVGELVIYRASVVDQVLQHAWGNYFPVDAPDIALVAVGGYGRKELHPGSDIDILILLSHESDHYREALEGFLTLMWDIGLEIGHSTRSLDACVREARDDITIATNLMESRLLMGPESLYETLRQQTGPQNIWPSRDFFAAKWEEQKQRYHKYHDTSNNLEPNIKEGPGGLRDIQMIGWVAKRHFDANSLQDLMTHGFLTEEECNSLWQGQLFLWKVRFALHILTGRREDRLLFDHQRSLAKQFGYEDEGHSMAVELFMKQYYRSIMELNRLNEMLLQLFQEEILLAEEASTPLFINQRFQIRKGFLEVCEPQTFRQHPLALLELFLLMEQHPQLKGVRANTIRLVRDNTHLIDAGFRNTDAAKQLFIQILSQPRGVTHELRRMNRYGVLAAYLPVFDKIVGLMQHDLFHVYTVDEHTMFVLRNLRRLTVEEYAHEYPLASKIITSLEKPVLVYIAALYHDIAKGRGGDHSSLGAVDARQFCREHDLVEEDTHLVAWLVEQHLMMSRISQRKDISDPDVINEFAALVEDQLQLDCLFLLTMADIRGTSPTVWNSWKHALLEELYRSTTELLSRGLEYPLQEVDVIEQMKSQALELLKHQRINQERLEQLWQRMPKEYFLHYSENELAWHAQSLLGTDHPETPLVLMRQQTARGGTEVFIYTRIQDRLFAQITAILEKLGLSIAAARLISSNDGYSFNTFIVLEEDGQPISQSMRIEETLAALRRALAKPDELPELFNRSLPRKLKHFPISTEVRYSKDKYHDHTNLEVFTMDRPGLLASLARIFLQYGIDLKNAKITTLGERAEDVFLITNRDAQAIDQDTQQALKTAIIEALDVTKTNVA